METIKENEKSRSLPSNKSPSDFRSFTLTDAYKAAKDNPEFANLILTDSFIEGEQEARIGKTLTPASYNEDLFVDEKQ